MISIVSRDLRRSGKQLPAFAVCGDAEFRAPLTQEQREWYLEKPDDPSSPFRKLDNPVYHRIAFRELATTPMLVEAVEQLIGAGVSVLFSQIFCKAPEVGGPKPVHQDNFYFGTTSDQIESCAIYFDDTDRENGCLRVIPKSHLHKEIATHNKNPYGYGHWAQIDE